VEQAWKGRKEMRFRKTMVFRLVFASLSACLLVKGADCSGTGVGMDSGRRHRASSTDPLPNVSVTLEGGIVEPQVMQQLMATAAGVGVTVTTSPGASTFRDHAVDDGHRRCPWPSRWRRCDSECREPHRCR